ncbi:MAG: helix-turn-helix transcriptional regulator [Pirellulales bacterium]
MTTVAVPSSRLLTRAEAAEFLGIRPQTLACWHTLGRYKLPLVRVGRSVRYRLADLEAWLANRTITHPGELQD